MTSTPQETSCCTESFSVTSFQNSSNCDAIWLAISSFLWFIYLDEALLPDQGLTYLIQGLLVVPLILAEERVDHSAMTTPVSYHSLGELTFRTSIFFHDDRRRALGETHSGLIFGHDYLEPEPLLFFLQLSGVKYLASIGSSEWTSFLRLTRRREGFAAKQLGRMACGLDTMLGTSPSTSWVDRRGDCPAFLLKRMCYIQRALCDEACLLLV